MKESSTRGVYSKLDDTKKSLAVRKRILGDFLRRRLDYQKGHPEQGMKIAYEIAGLLATNTARALPDDDLYKRIMDLAGNLELPEQHRGGVTWAQMAELIMSLPENGAS